MLHRQVSGQKSVNPVISIFGYLHKLFMCDNELGHVFDNFLGEWMRLAFGKG